MLCFNCEHRMKLCEAKRAIMWTDTVIDDTILVPRLKRSVFVIMSVSELLSELGLLE